MLKERFEFRDILLEEAEQAVLIEQICFPPNEACSEKHMKEAISARMLYITSSWLKMAGGSEIMLSSWR